VSVDGQIRRNGKVMKGAFDTLGYKQVCQYSKLKMVHRLVASRWLPAPTDNTCEIDHIDRNRSNNHASNLRWCSKSVNMINRVSPSPATNQPNITLYDMKYGGLRYVVRFQRNKKTVHHTYHKTLAEAIVDRDNYLLTEVR